MKEIYFMVGAPGAGKSTYIENNFDDNIIIFSNDKLRESFYEVRNKIVPKNYKEIYDYSEENKKDFSSYRYRMFKYLFELFLEKKDTIFIVDNTNIFKHSYKLINKELKRNSEINFKKIGIIFNIPDHVLKERNKYRENKNIYDSTTILRDKFKENLTFYKEYFDEYIEVQGGK